MLQMVTAKNEVEMLDTDAIQNGLQQSRGHDEFTLHALCKAGVIEKDKGGFYTYDTEVDALGNVLDGEKFYIEEAYAYLEAKILELRRAAWMYERHMTPELRNLGMVSIPLVLIDVLLTRLLEMHKGLIQSEANEEGFFSKRQINLLMEELTEDPSVVFDVIAEGETTPLGTAAQLRMMIAVFLQQDNPFEALA